MSDQPADQQEQPFDLEAAERRLFEIVRASGPLVPPSYESDRVLERALREIRRLQAENASLRERVEELESGIRLQGGPCSEWDREVT